MKQKHDLLNIESMNCSPEGRETGTTRGNKENRVKWLPKLVLGLGIHAQRSSFPLSPGSSWFVLFTLWVALVHFNL